MQNKPSLLKLLLEKHEQRAAEYALEVEAQRQQAPVPKPPPGTAVEVLIADLRRMIEERDRYRAALEAIRDAVARALNKDARPSEQPRHPAVE